MNYLLLTIISIIIFNLISKISRKFNLLDYPDKGKYMMNQLPMRVDLQFQYYI